MFPPSGPGESSLSDLRSWKYDQEKARAVLSHMIMVHELPFKFVEYDMFNIFMRTVAPPYQKISRTTAKEDCFKSYGLEKNKIKNLLKTVDRISITTDLWKSGQKISYMVITAHFIDLDWKLQKRVLNFVDVPPPHTGIAMADALWKCLSEWGIILNCNLF